MDSNKLIFNFIMNVISKNHSDDLTPYDGMNITEDKIISYDEVIAEEPILFQDGGIALSELNIQKQLAEEHEDGLRVMVCKYRNLKLIYPYRIDLICSSYMREIEMMVNYFIKTINIDFDGVNESYFIYVVPNIKSYVCICLNTAKISFEIDGITPGYYGIVSVSSTKLGIHKKLFRKRRKDNE